MQKREDTRTKVPFWSEPLVKLFVLNGLAGVAVSLLLLAGIFLTNTGNLRTLVLSAQDPVLPVLMLAVALIVTIVSVVIGSAVMLLGSSAKNNEPPTGRRDVSGLRFVVGSKAVATVPVTAGRRRR